MKFKKSDFTKIITNVKKIISSSLVDSINGLKYCDVLYFCHDVDRPLNLSGKAYSPLIDSLREDLEIRGLSSCSIAYPWSSLTGYKAHGEPASLNMAYLRFLLFRRLVRLIARNKKDVVNPYRVILKKTKAKLLITIGTPKELALAAREAGVFHIELLHGIGYTTIEWGWNELPMKYLPQGILSLDAISTLAFSPLKDKGIEIYTIPHIFLKRFYLDNYFSQPAEWRFELKNKKSYLKHILISLSWGYAGDHGPYIELENILGNGLFFDEVGDLVREEPDIFWHFRFHPVQLRNKHYKNIEIFMDNFVLSNPNSEWREASRVPFPSIAAFCDGNIGMSSMSCYDAAAVGVPSLMLCPNVQIGGIYQDFFIDLENEGYVTKDNVNKEMIRNWVRKISKMKPRLSNLEDDGAWEDAVEWMLHKSGLDERIKRRASI